MLLHLFLISKADVMQSFLRTSTTLLHLGQATACPQLVLGAAVSVFFLHAFQLQYVPDFSPSHQPARSVLLCSWGSCVPTSLQQEPAPCQSPVAVLSVLPSLGPHWPAGGGGVAVHHTLTPGWDLERTTSPLAP